MLHLQALLHSILEHRPMLPVLVTKEFRLLVVEEELHGHWLTSNAFPARPRAKVSRVMRGLSRFCYWFLPQFLLVHLHSIIPAW